MFWWLIVCSVDIEVSCTEKNKTPEYYRMNMKTWRLVRSQTYQCYSATCTPAQLSLLSDAIAKYSALKEREWLKGEKGKNRQSRSENQNQNKVSVQWGKKGKTFVILKRADFDRLGKRLVGNQDIWTAQQDVEMKDWHWREAVSLWVAVFVCFKCYSRALSQSFLSCCRYLPVAVNHLNHQPELQPNDGDIHHHLRQDGCQSPGD